MTQMIFQVLTEMLEIRGLCKDNIGDVARFCLGYPEVEDWYSKGDRKRISEAWRRKQKFLLRKLKDGASAQIAYKAGRPIGFIEYYPIEFSNLEVVGKDIMVIWCLNEKKQERGKNVGERLLQVCLLDSKRKNRKGVVVTCWDPIWMPSALLKKNGFVEVGKAVGNGVVLFKQFDEVEIPRWIGRGGNYEEAKQVEGKIVIDLFHTDRCLIHIRNTALVKDVAKEFGKRVVLNEVNVDNREDMLKYRIAYRVYLNGKVLAAGHLAKENVLRKRIRSELDKLILK